MTPTPPSGPQGFTWKMRFDSRHAFLRGVAHLLACHDHHFIVEQDTLSIKGSEMAMNCLKEIL